VCVYRKIISFITVTGKFCLQIFIFLYLYKPFIAINSKCVVDESDGPHSNSSEDGPGDMTQVDSPSVRIGRLFCSCSLHMVVLHP